MRILLVACCTLCYCSPALVLSLQHAPMAIAAAQPDASNDVAASRRVVLGERTKEVHRRRITKQQSASQTANGNIYDDTEAASSNATVAVGGDIQVDANATTKGDSTKAESTTKGGKKAKANKGSKPSKEQKPSSSKAGKSGSDTNVPPVSTANNINTVVCGRKLVLVDYLSLMIIFVLV